MTSVIKFRQNQAVFIKHFVARNLTISVMLQYTPAHPAFVVFSALQKAAPSCIPLKYVRLDGCLDSAT